ncbi:hypothetical protein ONZ45_g6225 [Pleurotus djamor]|nr:hypothetical protein ONZ45_g6225 [Pleurotus djamor]
MWSTAREIAAGDVVIVWLTRDMIQPLVVTPGKDLNIRFGYYRHDDLVGVPYGSKIRSRNGKGFIHVLRPTPELWTMALPHRTQILYLADIAFITCHLDVKPGSHVVEAAPVSFTASFLLPPFTAPRGTFFLTQLLLTLTLMPWDQFGAITSRTIGRSGHLYSYEFHEARATAATEEFARHGMSDFVTLTHRNVCSDGFTVENVADAMVASPYLVNISGSQNFGPSRRLFRRNVRALVLGFPRGDKVPLRQSLIGPFLLENQQIKVVNHIEWEFSGKRRGANCPPPESVRYFDRFGASNVCFATCLRSPPHQDSTPIIPDPLYHRARLSPSLITFPVFLDLPMPWNAIAHAKKTLRKDRLTRICCFSPCMEQVQRTVIALNDAGFTEITMYETLVRAHEVDQVPALRSIEDVATSLKKAEQKREDKRIRQIVVSRQNLAKRKRGDGGESDLTQVQTRDDGAEPVAGGKRTKTDELEESLQESGSVEPSFADMPEGQSTGSTAKIAVSKAFAEVRGHTSYLTFASLLGVVESS